MNLEIRKIIKERLIVIGEINSYKLISKLMG
jgi:hypothetical protein